MKKKVFYDLAECIWILGITAILVVVLGVKVRYTLMDMEIPILRLIAGVVGVVIFMVLPAIYLLNKSSHGQAK